MKNNFLNKSVANVYLKPSSNSEVVSQILYGEKFKILLKRKKYIKIKTHYDNYIGYIKKDKFLKNFKPSYKISKIKSRIFFKRDKRFLSSNHYLYYGSGVCKRNENKKYIEFEKNKWIKKSDIKNIDHHEKNYIKIFKFFLNTKYLWGGKTCDGIDCSALIQIYFYYNRIFFPRDTKDQIRFCKRKRSKNRLKGDIVFWKGHVGICLNKSRFIHAYGPKKKVIIMPTGQTIKLIDKTANLKVKKVSNISNI
ncbi:C40 family peptidase [Candidatus Pelagibacter sp.]|uniref:C40 family peptidase n=1 Tax=Candidatus Pelagibacter sp. TaxID=2024849 RepID=UPI003F851928